MNCVDNPSKIHISSKKMYPFELKQKILKSNSSSVLFPHIEPNHFKSNNLILNSNKEISRNELYRPKKRNLSLNNVVLESIEKENEMSLPIPLYDDINP